MHARVSLITASLALAVGSSEARAQTTEPHVRNVIVLIGDGMGPAQVGLLESWARLAPSSTYAGQPTAMARLAAMGTTTLSLTHPHGGLVVDSACSATQIATGQAAPSEVVGLNARGDIAQTVLEAAQAQGRATGLVSDTRITHATPAAFAAHVPHRRHEDWIAEQLAAGGVDVLLSGGLRYFTPQSTGSDHAAALAFTDGAFPATSARSDDRDLVAELRDRGATVVFDRDGLAAAPPTGRLVGLFANSGMRDAIAERNDERASEPTLAEMTRTALDRLDDDPDGFFLMVEAGQIDWAAHDNDAGWMLAELLRFDAAIDEVLRWAEGRDDTWIVLTADHETGGFGLSYSRAGVPSPTTLDGDGMLGQPLAPQFNFGDVGMLELLGSQQRTLAAVVDDLSEPETSYADVVEAVRAATGVAITIEDAAAILSSEPNIYHVEGHEYLDALEFPAIGDFEAFYVYADGIRQAQIARALADELGVVWSNGTHTASPVAVITSGPAELEAQLAGIGDHVSLGRALFGAIGAEVSTVP